MKCLRAFQVPWQLNIPYSKYLPIIVSDEQGQAALARTISGADKYAMTDNGDNDTSVQSKVERDETVATKEGSSERSSEWWNSNDKVNQP